MVRQLPSSACGKIRLKLIQLNFRQGMAGQPATNRRQIRVVKMQSKWRTANAINCEICCWINSAQSAECRMRYTLQCVGKAKLSHSFATLSTPTNWRQRVFASLAISAENIFKMSRTSQKSVCRACLGMSTCCCLSLPTPSLCKGIKICT